MFGIRNTMKDTNLNSLQLNIYGMTCANCVSRIEKGLKKIPGIKKTSINLALEIGSVEFEDHINSEIVISSIEKLGYGASIRKNRFSTTEDNLQNDKFRNLNFYFLVLSFLLSLPLFFSMFTHINAFHSALIFHFLSNPLLQLLLSTPIVFIFGFKFHKNALLSLKNLQPGMDTLVSIGSLSSYFYSIYLGFYTSKHSHLYFETASLLITFVLLGKFLENNAKHKTSKAITKLINLRPKSAQVIRDNIELELPIDSLKEDDICIVKVGDLIPTDGVIVQGSSEINESMLTGESNPIYKEIGDTVFGGTINISNTIKIRINSLGDKTILSKIIKLVSDAQSTKAPVQRIADTIAGIFVPFILLTSFSCFFIHYYYLNPYIINIAFDNALSVLVIACPCALGLATPASIMAGTGRAAEVGVLFRSAESLEIAHKCDTFIFDKTGTLTKGNPIIEKIIPTIDSSETEILHLSAIAEKLSPHPISKGIIEHALMLNIPVNDPDEFEYTPGLGTKIKYCGDIITCGSYKTTKSSDLINFTSIIDKYESEGCSIVYIYKNDIYKGMIILKDPIKETAFSCIQSLKSMNKKIVLLSGDKKRLQKP